MAFNRKNLFFGDRDDIYEMHSLDLFSNTSRGQKESFDFAQEKNELVKFCTQILNSYKIEESSVQIALDLESLEEVVNHLAMVETNILQFNIDKMIELNMQEFITDIVYKVCIEQYDINFEVLSNLIHLIRLWTNGTKEQISTLINEAFTSYFFSISNSFFMKDSKIVGYSIGSIKNLLIEKYFPNEAILEIMTELLLILDRFLNESHKINNVFLKSVKKVFLCFQAVLQQKKIKKLPQMDVFIEMTKKWIDLFQEKFFDSQSIYPFKPKSQKNDWGPITSKDNPADGNGKENDDDFVDYDVMCQSLCAVIRCMNDIVSINNETANFFFNQGFITTNLLNYLKSTNVNLKKNGLNTLLTSLTVIGSDDFTAWDFVDAPIWLAVENITYNEFDTDLKLILCNVINSILYIMPTIMQIYEKKKQMQSILNNPDQQQATPTQAEQKQEEEEADKKDEQAVVGDKAEEEEEQNSEEYKKMIIESFINNKNDEEEEEEENEDDEEEDDDDHDLGENDFVYTPTYDLIYNLFEYGVLSRILSLSGSQDEPLSVRLAATLAIAKNINIFMKEQMTHLIHGGAIRVFIDSLEILDEKQIEIVFDAIWKFFEYIDKADDKETAKCVNMFDLASAEFEFQKIMDNPIFEGKLDRTVTKCIDKLGQLRERTPIEQRKKSEESLKRKKMIGDDDMFVTPNEYDEHDDD